MTPINRPFTLIHPSFTVNITVSRGEYGMRLGGVNTVNSHPFRGKFSVNAAFGGSNTHRNVYHSHLFGNII